MTIPWRNATDGDAWLRPDDFVEEDRRELPRLGRSLTEEEREASRNFQRQAEHQEHRRWRRFQLWLIATICALAYLFGWMLSK